MKSAFSICLVKVLCTRPSIGDFALLVVALLNKTCFIISFSFYYYLSLGNGICIF